MCEERDEKERKINGRRLKEAIPAADVGPEKPYILGPKHPSVENALFSSGAYNQHNIHSCVGEFTSIVRYRGFGWCSHHRVTCS